ncbi:hypothetical protein WOLCODRAFT_137658 [Wolfiporia cocos MD-104 SS10]|uniref:Uncharacterized protein n=1 Tax=Wolfiporia cocos (strain MD-104) TaxID=742152 RepID=A0A2H3JZ81_WOLCO|nr:hypothetical protein WOLCODRAFT_137658 [Wolfiporia cocos MD-104 SS10]
MTLAWRSLATGRCAQHNGDMSKRAQCMTYIPNPECACTSVCRADFAILCEQVACSNDIAKIQYLESSLHTCPSYPHQISTCFKDLK